MEQTEQIMINFFIIKKSYSDFGYDSGSQIFGLACLLWLSLLTFAYEKPFMLWF